VSVASSFFGSGTWLVIRNLGGLFLLFFWLATVLWILKDAKRRLEDPWITGVGVLVGIVAPFLGVFIYMLLRPPEYLEDVRERELEIKAMEDRLSKRDLHCPVCRSEVDVSFLVCPICTTKLKQACVSCKQPLEALWQVCPYCETPVEPAAVVLPTLEPPRRRRSSGGSAT
jgi:hypothetical protein